MSVAIEKAVIGLPTRCRDHEAVLQKLVAIKRRYLGQGPTGIKYYAVLQAVLPDTVKICTDQFWKILDKDDNPLVYIELGDAAVTKIQKYCNPT